MAEKTGTLTFEAINWDAVESRTMTNLGLSAQDAGFGNFTESRATAALSAITLKAEPAAMEQKAGQISNAIGRMRNIYQEMTRIVSRTSGYWNGEAAELHRNRYKEMQPELERIFSCLESNVANLKEIAAVYTGTQSTITAMAQALPKDAIE